MKQLIFKVDILLPEYRWEGDLEKFTNAKGCFLRCARLANINISSESLPLILIVVVCRLDYTFRNLNEVYMLLVLGSVWFDNEHNWLTLRVTSSCEWSDGPGNTSEKLTNVGSSLRR